MSGRAILSRPRTRIYDANYNISENYYRPALERLDRKYSGRPSTPPPRATSVPRDLLDRHERAFAGEDIFASRRRAEKHITENHLFDSRGGRIAQTALDLANGFDEETASALQRIRASKKVSLIDDVDMESTVNNISARRLLDRSDKMLKCVGLDDSARRALDEDVSIKRRALKVTYEDNAKDLTRWRPIVDERESGAVVRARQTRDRLSDIEDEMAALAEKQAARERRAARLKAFVAENVEETEAAQSALNAISFRVRREEKSVEE